jgi:dihydrodiol dehydrogenase / D-xylose 1-dehydrogenase (NADP)
MVQKIRWGFISTGKIAHTLAQTITPMSDGEIVAVGSRTQAAADEFGAQYGIKKCYGTYEELANDPDVDVVYIATPHNLHYDNMKLCLNAGKHVLCEKAFTLNAPQAAECIALAREKGLFLMEAMWTRYFPAIKRARAMISDGTLGDVRALRAELCLDLDKDPTHRIYSKDLAGGALLDVGIYPLSFAIHMFGLPQTVNTTVHMAHTGVDEYETMQFAWDNGRMAYLAAGVLFDSPRDAVIMGTKGWVRVIGTHFIKPHTLVLKLKDQAEQVLDFSYPSTGYQYEIEEVHACLRAGKLESDLMPLDESLKIMQLMDSMRAEWGLKYPEEQ